jgi:hypothetical protein
MDEMYSAHVSFSARIQPRLESDTQACSSIVDGRSGKSVLVHIVARKLRCKQRAMKGIERGSI